MRSLFRRTFAAFMGILVVLLAILGGALVAGYHQSLSTWSARRVTAIEDAARLILTGRPAAEHAIPQDIPVFVYRADGTLVASNRGVGRQRDIEHEQHMPIRVDGQLVGYYTVGSVQFRDDAANQALTESLIRAAVAGALVASAVAAAAAFGFARRLSSPAANVAAGIDAIARGSLGTPIPEEGAAEIRRIAHAANMLADRLRNEQSLRAQWAQDVTHDLRTPIASIRAQLEAIVDGVYAPEPARIQATLAELSRVEQLIGDLEELMRLEEPDVHLNITSFAAAQFAATLAQRFEHEIAGRRIAFAMEIDLNSITSDEVLLDRTVSNILANAVRHVSEGGRVGLAIQADAPAGVRIVVRNDGPPIPPDELPHLFDRLYRGEYARNTPGSGLGLTIARRIVLLLGGTIEITSAAATGTAVTICLPPA